MRRETWDDAGQLLFGSGWGFIVPYLFVALAAAWLGVAVPVVLVSFQALHFVIGGVFLVWAAPRLRHLSPGFLLVSVLMTLFFLLPGAYLEFPHDAWDHYRRIVHWGRQEGVLTHTALVDEFAFLWNASLISWVPPAGHRLALDLVSTFWQLLLGWQFYRLFRRFGEPAWAGVQVIGTVALYGNNLFCFYRHLALAATPLSYIAYLQGVIAIIDILDRWRPGAERSTVATSKAVGVLGLCVLVTYYNHLQELMFLGISGLALVFARLWEHRTWRRTLLIYVGALFAASLIAGWWTVSTYWTVPTPWGPAFEKMPHVSALGTFRLWDMQIPYFEALALHGVIGLGVAVVLFRTRPRLASLTLAPVVMSLFPPFVFLFGAVYAVPTWGWITYRVLLAFPASVMFVEGLLALWRVVREARGIPGGRWVGTSVVTAAILFIGLFPDFPVRGRLWLQLYRPPPVLSLSGTEEMAEWFRKRPERGASCVVAADHATQWLLATHFDAPESSRLFTWNLGDEVANLEELKAYVRRRGACSLLVARPENAIPLSTVATKSGHWLPHVVRADLVPSDEFTRLLGRATRNGWRRIEVPPFYELYVPPREGGDESVLPGKVAGVARFRLSRQAEPHC